MKNVTGTEIKYDGMYIEEEAEIVRGFRSSELNRYDFKGQKKSDFQDDEDKDNELTHSILISQFKNLCDALDLELESFEKDHVSENTTNMVKKSKKKRIKLNYDEDNEESMPNLSINLKKVTTNMKFQKNISKNDPIFTNFIRADTIPAHAPKIIAIPEDFIPKYQINHADPTKLSSKTASILLKTRFTNSASPVLTTKPKTRRTITSITIDPLLKTRLNIP